MAAEEEEEDGRTMKRPHLLVKRQLTEITLAKWRL